MKLRVLASALLLCAWQARAERMRSAAHSGHGEQLALAAHPAHRRRQQEAQAKAQAEAHKEAHAEAHADAHAAPRAVPAAQLGEAEHSDAADDLFACVKVAKKFLDADLKKAEAIKKAEAHCRADKDLEDANYVCPHFKEGVSRALELEVEDRQYDAEAFCEATEAYMINIRGAARVPRTGSGSLLNFKASPHCESAVSAAFAPDKTLASSSVPDFWYAMCMNQDCAHFLPSRARWCNVQREPTHSVTVCEAARKFALDEIVVHEKSSMSAEQICTLYAEFVKEMGIDVDAYEQVIHGKKPHESMPRSQGHGRASLQAAKVPLLALFAAVAAVGRG